MGPKGPLRATQNGGASGPPGAPPLGDGSRRPAAWRLGGSASPYLRQHADNAVAWRPWGEDALAEARRRDVPLFVSIGYSTCHWCHVMERESFRDEAIGRFVNEHFVPVKVDREEHPDVDAFYIDAVGALGGSTGWPLNVFTLPSGAPFFGGTYLPPRPAFGRPSFRQVIEAVVDLYRTRRGDLEAQARQITDAVTAALRPTAGPVRDETARAALDRLQRVFDMDDGGFGRGQKFPNAPLLRAEIAAVAAGYDEPFRAHLDRTLDAMARGGVRDALAGTFHRYAVDRTWHLPHFEKTLYDNAQLVEVYLRAWVATGEPRWRSVACAIARDLVTWQRLGGGLVVGFDADDPGGEGAYYTWTAEAIERVLGPEEGRFVCTLFGVGTRQIEALEGRSVLHRIDAASEHRAWPSQDAAAIERRFEALRPRLLEARARRPAPAVDDKLLVGWNGLAAAALAECGRMTSDATLVERAEAVGRFLMDGALDEGGRLCRGRANDARLGPATLEDVALSAYGLYRVHVATGKGAFLRCALARTRAAFDHYYDRDARVFHHLPVDGDPGRPLPPSVVDPGHDGVLPGPASAAIRIGLELGLAAGDEALVATAFDALAAHAGAAPEHPTACGFLLETLLWWLGPVRTIVLAGAPQDPDTRALANVLADVPVGRVLPVFVDPSDDGRLPTGARAACVPLGGRAAAYVCRRDACEAPVTDPGDLAATLAAAGCLPRAGEG